MRKRLPEPNPRMGKVRPVRPRVRVGSLESELADEVSAQAPLTAPMATVWRNCRRFMSAKSNRDEIMTRAKSSELELEIQLIMRWESHEKRIPTAIKPPLPSDSGPFTQP